MPSEPSSDRDFLRHTVATLAYRAEKVLRDPPEEFAAVRLSDRSRSAVEIVSHMGDLMDWGERMARGEYVWDPRPTTDWTAACDRFFASLKNLDDALATVTLEKYPADMIFQGPVADALTHVGQLAIMRGVSSGAVRPESYARAEILAGRVGREQSSVRKEFEGDASRRKPRAPEPPPVSDLDPVNEASDESFPASDPPANTPIDGTHIAPQKS